jgi:diketogulonate reductase-like aldo/keto reductase
VAAGKIARWGVSNFDTGDLEELAGLRGGEKVAADQILYNLMRRGAEHDLLPWCRARGVAVMAYSPVEEGRLARHPALAKVAQRLGATPAQVALAWLVRQPQVIAIPKAVKPEHVRENRAAANLVLDAQVLREIDAHFAPPRGKTPLEMI